MENKKCPICREFKVADFLKRYNVPVHQNYVFKSEKEAFDTISGDLSLSICKDCGFIFNRKFESNKLSYDINYDNTQDISYSFKQYLTKEISYIKQNFNLEQKNVIEIGCGKGNFLKQLVEETNCNAVGFDPSYIGDNNFYNGKLKFIKDFYDKRYSDFKADFIVCRHVLEHIPDPVAFLAGIKKALENSKNPICFFETPSVEWILKNKVMYDFFYEHCSYFDDVSISKLFGKTGFNVLEIRHEFSEQYMWVIAEVKESCNKYEYDKKIVNLEKLALEYSEEITSQIQSWKNKLSILIKEGNVSVWGAGAKGVTFVNLVDPERQLIDSLIDINRSKQGAFVPKTAHEIIDYKNIKKRNIKNIIVMNDNYFNEINQFLAEEKISVNLLTGVS